MSEALLTLSKASALLERQNNRRLRLPGLEPTRHIPEPVIGHAAGMRDAVEDALNVGQREHHRLRIAAREDGRRSFTATPK
jgi:hypothetical protein